MEQIQLPELYPGWRSVRKIGSGSFGTVYEIERDLFGEKERSALKHIRLPQNDSEVDELYSSGYDEAGVTAHYETCLAGIVREYSLMAQMKGHGNVVYCDDVRYTARTDGVGWDITIRMELLTPLLKTLSAAYDESVVVRIGRDISRALVRCQEMNIVHRDVKPQNIFVSGSGSYKLGDFGIARTMEKTSGGTRIGTYSYMAPEVYLNQPYGSSADIYSLGLVLYWLMNERRLPFLPLPPQTPTYGQNEQARARRLNGEPLPLPKNGSAALQAIVRKACAYDPAERFASARELLDALEQIPVTEDRPEIPAEPVPVPREPEEDMTWRMVPAVPQQEEPAERTLWDEPLQRTAAPKQLPRVPAVPTDAELVRPKPRVPAASPNAGTVRPAPKVPAATGTERPETRVTAAPPVTAAVRPTPKAAVATERKPEPPEKKKPVKKKKRGVFRTLLVICVILAAAAALLYLLQDKLPWAEPDTPNDVGYPADGYTRLRNSNSGDYLRVTFDPDDEDWYEVDGFYNMTTAQSWEDATGVEDLSSVFAFAVLDTEGVLWLESNKLMIYDGYEYDETYGFDFTMTPERICDSRGFYEDAWVFSYYDEEYGTELYLCQYGDVIDVSDSINEDCYWIME